jgi:DNA-binding transcriptional LysR family regulator
MMALQRCFFSMILQCMELRHLKAFKAVAEELHFSRAAAKLNVAQPALSRTMMDLESEMGVRLVDRNSRGVTLTEAGGVFLERVRRILDETEDAVHAARRRSRGETGSLRIGFIGTLSFDLLPRLLRAYRAVYPAVDLMLREMGPTRQRSEILAGTLDCGFIGLSSGMREEGLEMVLAAEDSLVAAVPDTHRLAGKSRLRLVDLKHDPFYLTARANAPAFNPWLIGLCQRAGFEPQIAFEIDRSATVLNYIAAGFGVSVFPSRVAAMATPGVRFMPFSGKLPRYQYKLAWARGNPSKRVADFATLVKRHHAGPGRSLQP